MIQSIISSILSHRHLQLYFISSILQRIDNSSSEVCTLLSIADSLLCAIVDSGLDLSPQVCGNILYGLQNCSIADESTRRIMYCIVDRYCTAA